MQIRSMDEELVVINNIRNLTSVKIWDLVQHDKGKDLVVPAILITYDGGKQLNLCAKDNYFNEYVRKVIEVYRDEKDDILEDALTDPFRLRSSIDIDEYTKKILESGNLERISEIYRFYQDKEVYENSLSFQVDDIKSLIKLVQYHIIRLFSNTDRTIVFKSDFSGFRDNYVMMGQVDGIEHYFPFTIDKKDGNNYSFSINGLVNKNIPVMVDVSFKKDEISVVCFVDGYELREESRYVVTNGVIKEIHDVTRKGITIGYKNNDLERTDSNPLQNISELDEDVDMSFFVLPWGAVYGCNVVVDDVSDYEKVITIHNMYCDADSDSFVKKEYFSKNYKRNRTATLDSEDMMMDEVRKNVLGVSIDRENRLFVIETEFFGIGTMSDSKYYYTGCYAEDGISGVVRKRLVGLSHDKNIIRNSDLVNKHRILKLVKGE